MELCWPFDRYDYLTVCDNHPTPYRSNAAQIADHGDEDESELEHEIHDAAKRDYRIVGERVCTLQWLTLRQLADRMEAVSKNDVAIVAHQLKRAVDGGLAERRLEFRAGHTVSGKPRFIFVYRRKW